MMTHDELMHSLADHFIAPNRMVWRDLQLGPAGSARPDVYVMSKSFVRPNPIAYECKVNLSDFRADVTAGKWMTYLKYACAVVFAVERGLVSKADIPAKAGLIVRNDAGQWRMAKRPTLEAVQIPSAAYLKLLIDGVYREGPFMRRKAWGDHVATEKIRKKFGDTVADILADSQAVRYKTELADKQADAILRRALSEAERIREEDPISVERDELCEILGLKKGSSTWNIKAAIRALRREQEKHPAQRNLELLTKELARLVKVYGAVEPELAELKVSEK